MTDILSQVFDLVWNFNFFNDMPSIFQDRLEAFDVVERRTKDMAEQLEAIVARIPENPNVTPWLASPEMIRQYMTIYENLWCFNRFQVILSVCECMGPEFAININQSSNEFGKCLLFPVGLFDAWRIPFSDEALGYLKVRIVNNMNRFGTWSIGHSLAHCWFDTLWNPKLLQYYDGQLEDG